MCSQTVIIFHDQCSRFASSQKLILKLLRSETTHEIRHCNYSMLNVSGNLAPRWVLTLTRCVRDWYSLLACQKRKREAWVMQIYSNLSPSPPTPLRSNCQLQFHRTSLSRCFWAHASVLKFGISNSPEEPKPSPRPGSGARLFLFCFLFDTLKRKRLRIYLICYLFPISCVSV